VIRIKVQRTKNKVFKPQIPIRCVTLDFILESETSWLERAFKEEIRKVMSAMNVDKVSGPNSFSMAFFQAC
jgi:hypothetical protein